MIKRRYDPTTGRLGAAYPDNIIVPEPYVTLSNAENDKISSDSEYIYFYKNGEFTKTNKADIEEEIRIAKLNMTKLDFFKYVIEPNGIDYTQLLAIIKSDPNMQAEWDLCGAVYRGNDFLKEENIKKFLPNLTKEILDEIFKLYGREGE